MGVPQSTSALRDVLTVPVLGAIIPRLMQSGLPNIIQPWKLAAEASSLEGQIALSSMVRLSDMLVSSDGDVAVQLDAGVDAEGVSHLRLSLDATVTVVCQRCMEPLVMPLQVASQLGLGRDEAQLEALPAAYDPLLLPGETATLAELVEDELLLALPFAPRCADPSVCGRAPALGEPSTGPGNRPFEALSVLLNESKRKE